MYRFEKVSEDTYKLICDEKEFTFTRTIDLMRELQRVDIETTIILSEELATRGETLDNNTLIVERKENGNTIIDETNFNKVKEEARKIAYYNILDRIFKKLFNETYVDMIAYSGAETIEDGIKFIQDISKVITSGIKEDTPREQN